MNLKLVVASMSVLGLVSCPVFAATKHKPYKHHKKQIVQNQSDYKGMEVLPVAAPEVCTISQSSMMLDSITQNMGRSLPNACNPNWFNRVQLSGGLNVDIGKWGNRNANLMGENYQRLSLNDVYINLQATINDWARAFASISYNTATINSGFIDDITAEYSSAYSNNVAGGTSNTLQIEQAFMTLGNFDVSPIFVQIGKQFQDFSRYEIHPITRSLTQVMSETLATSGKLGFLASGFSGSLFVFDNPIPKVGQNAAPTNYGASLGFEAPGDAFGWDIGAAYLYDLNGVNDIAYIVNQYNTTLTTDGGFNSRVPGLAMYADMNVQPFVLGLRYTTALDNFNIADLPENGTAPSTTGAKPWAAGAQAGYGFEGMGTTQNIYIGYQRSGEAGALLLPKYRWLAGYGLDVWKNTNFTIEWDHDNAYSTSDGGTGNTTNLVSLRAAVKFG